MDITDGGVGDNKKCTTHVSPIVAEVYCANNICSFLTAGHRDRAVAERIVHITLLSMCMLFGGFLKTDLDIFWL